VERVSEGVADWERVLARGGLIVGGAGCGKSHKLVELFNSLDEESKKTTAVLSYTNAGAQNLRERGVPAATLNSLMFDGAEGLTDRPLGKFTRIVLDEFTMIPQAELGMILNAAAEVGIVVLAFGDPNQCKAPVTNWINYDMNRLFMAMCGNYVVTMSYKAGFARYDQSLKSVLDAFLATKRFSCALSHVESYSNICFTNAKRHAINKECFARWVAEHKAKIAKFGFPVAAGLPVMCYHGKDVQQQVFKTQVWTVKTVGKELITLEREQLDAAGKRERLTVQFDRTQFKALFDYAFAFTVHKAQGLTIHGHYNIHEADIMTADVMYTALSRGTTLANVHVVAALRGVYPDPSRLPSVLFKPKEPVVQRGRIYRIAMRDGWSYVGKTVRTLEERLAEHLESPTNAVMREHLDSSATIELLAEFNFVSTAIFNAVEACYIAAHAGDKLANVQHNVKKVAPKTVAPKQAKAIPVVTCEKTRRYIVQLRRAGVAKEDQVKRFPWGEGKEEALAAATEWVAQLTLKYF
jgi:hypothetical protein